MAKTPVEVNRQALVTAINKAESNGPLANRSLLWAKVAEEYNAAVKPTKPLTPSVVYLRVGEWKLEVKTPKGKKGRVGGIRVPGKRTAKKEKIAANTAYQKNLAMLRHELRSLRDDKGKQIGERFLPLVDQIEKGSRSAAVKLQCLGCSGYSTVEVHSCGVEGCPLWIFRPYQRQQTNGDTEPVDDPELAEESDEEEAA